MEIIVVKVKTLVLALGAIFMGTAVQAAPVTNQQVTDLQNEVAQLKQLVTQLANQQQQQAVQLQERAAPAPVVAPTIASSKPGWITLADGQTQLKVYGSVRADATYDFAGVNSATSIYNATDKVPLNSTNATKDSLNVSAAASRVGVEMIRPTQYGDLNAKLEADFLGSNVTNGNGSFRVRHAYVALDRWLVGQTTSPFANGDTSPEGVDLNGEVGSGTKRTVQVRYTQPISDNQKVLVALEGGDVENFTRTSQTTGGGRFPAVTARYDIKTADKKGLLQLHGLIHENRVSTTKSNTEEKIGWGVGIGGKYQITPEDALFANYAYVKGDSKYILYTNPAYAVVAQGSDNYDLYESEYGTALLGYGHKWNNQWRSTLAAGALWYKGDNKYAQVNEIKSEYNKSLYNVILNTFYTPVKSIDLGAEYTYGQRKTFTDQKGDYSRLNLMARYNF